MTFPLSNLWCTPSCARTFKHDLMCLFHVFLKNNKTGHFFSGISVIPKKLTLPKHMKNAIIMNVHRSIKFWMARLVSIRRRHCLQNLQRASSHLTSSCFVKAWGRSFTFAYYRRIPRIKLPKSSNFRTYFVRNKCFVTSLNIRSCLFRSLRVR